jgi:tetratricopeptide (TPR) repeat protein
LFALSTLHGEEAQQSQVLENRAYADVKAKNYSSAEQNYEKALVEARKSGDKEWRTARLFSALADLYKLEGRPDKAEQQYRATLEAYSQIHPADSDQRSGLARTHLELMTKIATALADQGKEEAAITQYQRALDGASARGLNPFDKMHVARQYALLLRKMHRDQEAEELETGVDTMIDYKGYFNKGIADFVAGRFDAAHNYFEVQLRAANKANVPDQAARAMTSLALCELAANHPKQAQTWCGKSLDLCPKVALAPNQHERESENFTVLAVCKEFEGDTKESKVYCNKAVSHQYQFMFPTIDYLQRAAYYAVNPTVLMDAVDTVTDRVRDYATYDVFAKLELNIALHKEHLKLYKEAEKRFLDTIDLFNKVKNADKNATSWFGTGAALSGLARIYKDEGNLVQAKQTFQRAVERLKQTKLKYPGMKELNGISIDDSISSAQSELDALDKATKPIR